MHNDDVASNRMGFKYVWLASFGRDYEPWGIYAADAKKTFADSQVAWWAIIGAALVISAFAVRHLALIFFQSGQLAAWWHRFADVELPAIPHDHRCVVGV